MSLKDYYQLAKPGIIYGNAITVIGGFLLASRGDIKLGLFLATLAGISLVIASGCVFNNYIERDVDGNMARTKNRALVTGKISEKNALVFGAVLGVVGFFILIFYTNFLAAAAAAAGFFFYVFMYSLWFKRTSTWGTLIGAVAGATPPVVGYCAASGKLDTAALILFFIMMAWQMPHFFAIAIRRLEDYAAAKIPVMPVVYGIRATKFQMLFYIIIFTLVAPLLTVFGYLGYAYFIIALLLGFIWLGLCVKGFFISDSAAEKFWARQMFFFSLIVMVVLFTTIAISAIL